MPCGGPAPELRFGTSGRQLGQVRRELRGVLGAEPHFSAGPVKLHDAPERLLRGVRQACGECWPLRHQPAVHEDAHDVRRWRGQHGGHNVAHAHRTRLPGALAGVQAVDQLAPAVHDPTATVTAHARLGQLRGVPRLQLLCRPLVWVLRGEADPEAVLPTGVGSLDPDVEADSSRLVLVGTHSSPHLQRLREENQPWVAGLNAAGDRALGPELLRGSAFAAYQDVARPEFCVEVGLLIVQPLHRRERVQDLLRGSIRAPARAHVCCPPEQLVGGCLLLLGRRRGGLLVCLAACWRSGCLILSFLSFVGFLCLLQVFLRIRQVCIGVEGRLAPVVEVPVLLC
mmetsp:Transcript_50762/g.140826  ORF Transcript_50762/g.140826 Transcript_50762/m.140826 type:complete len:341 (+) Transcript_50762:135-1157(+)